MQNEDPKKRIERVNKLVTRTRWIVIGTVLLAALLIILQAFLGRA